MKSLFVLALMLSTLSACSKDSSCPGSVHCKMRNKTGLDGCGWVLQLDDNSYLEANNLNNFGITFEEGKDLHVTYEEVNGGSVCMVGKIVQINCLSED